MAVVDIKAEVSGSVWKIEAGAGDAVAWEEPILILESMKMEIPVSPERPGTVVEILVEEGDAVEEGAVVARLEVPDPLLKC